MATEVRHGPHAQFDAPLSGGKFGIEIIGRYTEKPGLAAGGVTQIVWNSDRPDKRRSELLVLRTCFLEWFVEQWRGHGGSWIGAVEAITQYPFKEPDGPA